MQSRVESNRVESSRGNNTAGNVACSNDDECPWGQKSIAFNAMAQPQLLLLYLFRSFFLFLCHTLGSLVT